MNGLRGSPSIIVFLFYFACLWTSALSICPSKCNCDDENLRVNCSDADLTVIPITLNPDLRQFHLQNNHIKHVTSSFGVYHNLQYLDVSNNQLVSVDLGAFVQQRRLKVLLLGMNTISSLQNETFKGLSSLEVLHLNTNQLEELENGVFSPLTKLETLDLSHNRLSQLSDDAFAGLSSLKTLLLRDNRLRTVPSSPLSRVQRVLKLDLGFNPLSEIPVDAFSSTNDLESLELDQCNLETLEKGSFKGLSSLLTLKLSDNKLDNVPTEALSDTSRLEELSIGQNLLTEIGPDAFAGLKYLKSLDVRGCRTLTAVRRGAFTSNPNLENIVFERNPDLRFVENGVFNGLPNLKVISLRANGLEHLDHNLLPWDELELLDARDNPLVCNCSLMWLRNFLLKINSSSSAMGTSAYETGSYKIPVEENSKVYCQNPEHLKGQLVSDLTAHDFDCDLDFAKGGVIIGAVVGVIFLILIGLAVAALYFREKIAGVLKTKWSGNRKEPQYQKTYGEEENNILQAAQHPLKNTPVTEL